MKKQIKLINTDCLSDGYAICSKNEENYFELCLKEQEQGKRNLYIAYYNDKPIGYINLIFNPAYIAFRKTDSFEIQDLFVMPEFRKMGIGTDLITHCENEAKKLGAKNIGIGVGLHRDYGAAQRLYVQLGYIPDGAGVVYDNQQVVVGEMRAVDDFLCLKLVKTLI